ncbi:MAG: hypothetical protein KF722_04480 [Nitrospira sp.]|nr:hypothetical protein [Nitrospira sp.]
MMRVLKLYTRDHLLDQLRLTNRLIPANPPRDNTQTMRIDDIPSSVTAGRVALWCRRIFWVACLLVSTSCAKSLDMSGDRIAVPGNEWGVVVGSVEIEAEMPEKPATIQPLANETFILNVVQIQPGDPEGLSPYADTYELTTKAGEDKLFVSRLRPGRYLIRSFQASGFMGLGGDIKAEFTVEPGAVRYIGRLHITVPRYLSQDRPYRFTLKNAQQADLAKLTERHPDLANDMREAPMELRAATP